MNEKAAMEYIEKITAYGSVPGLASITELCRRIGDPQKKLSFVHVAGTNGKGSVCAYLASILKCAGYRVGKYSSPAVFSYYERFQVGGRNISKKSFGELLETVAAAADQMEEEGMAHPTVFEVETALAFLWFQQQNCDLVVLETGMGGALDATNLIENTIAAVFASISMDHMAFLGRTIEEITRTKAGIIKNNCYVISGIQDPIVTAILQEEAEKHGALFRQVIRKNITKMKSKLNKQSYCYLPEKLAIEISLLGSYQIENSALAVEVCHALREKGYQITDQQMLKGLMETSWPGRCTIIAQKPLFMIDGAHNEDAAKKLAQTIEYYFTNKKIIYIMGVLKDKEVEKIVQNTFRYAEHIITVASPGNPRALPAYDLAQVVSEYHSSVTVADSVEEAVEIAYLLADRDGVIIAFGSLSYLGRLTEVVKIRK